MLDLRIKLTATEAEGLIAGYVDLENVVLADGEVGIDPSPELRPALAAVALQGVSQGC